MSAIPQPIPTNAPATQAAGPLGLYGAERYGRYFGEDDAARAARLRWVKSLCEVQRQRDVVSGHMFVRGAALLPNGQTVEQFCAVLPLFSGVPDDLRRNGNGDQRQRFLAERRFVASVETLWATYSAKAKYGEWMLAEIARVNAGLVSEFNFPVGKSALGPFIQRVTAGQCDGRIRSGRKAKPFGVYDPRLIAAVNTAYLRECKSIPLAWELQRDVALSLGVEAMSRWDVRRYVESIPEDEKILAREGKKAFEDKCVPRVGRCYGKRRRLEIVVFDGSTLPIWMQRETADGLTRAHPILIAFMDMWNREIVGFVVAIGERWEDTLAGVKMVCREAGLPETWYYDNGSAFIAALGSGWTGQIAPLIEVLGSKLVNSIPGNAPSRGVIERFNRTVQEDFCRDFHGYCKPDSADDAEVDRWSKEHPEQLPTQAEVAERFGRWLKSRYHERQHGGDGMQGRSPRQKLDDWKRANPGWVKRVVPEDVLDFAAAKLSETRIVRKGGVRIGKEWYGGDNVALLRLKRWKVRLRIDGELPACAVVCDEIGKPILDAETQEPIVATTRGLRDRTQDELRESLSIQNRYRRLVRDADKLRGFMFSSEEGRVEMIREARAEGVRTAEEKSKGPAPAGNLRIVGGELAPAARIIAQQKDSAAGEAAPAGELTEVEELARELFADIGAGTVPRRDEVSWLREFANAG